MEALTSKPSIAKMKAKKEKKTYKNCAYKTPL
jgi:hypothetical protein